MMTWRLWRWLKKPLFRHPLFRHVNIHQSALPRLVQRYIGFVGLALCIAFVLFPGILTVFLLMLVLVPLVFIIFNGTFFGAVWAMTIGDTIAKERGLGTYDLLCASPAGILGTHWLLGAGAVHRNRALDQIHGILRGILVVILVTLLIITAVIFLNVGPSRVDNLMAREQQRILLTLLTVTAVLVGIYLDQIQSFIQGSLVGMMAPHYVQSRVEARVWAVSVFLLLQVGVYVLFWLAGVNLVEAIFRVLQISGTYTDFGLAFVRVCVFYVIRESVIVVLWKFVTDRLNADTRELDLMLHAAE